MCSITLLVRWIDINGGESEAKFDAFYAEGVGLSWRKDADEEAMHFVEDKSGALPQKRVGAKRNRPCITYN